MLQRPSAVEDGYLKELKDCCNIYLAEAYFHAMHQCQGFKNAFLGAMQR